MSMSPEILEAAVVAVGSFNPPIVNVDWLQHHGLIGDGDAEVARSNDGFIVSRPIAKFQTDAFAVQVLENQLSISSLGPVTPALPDLAMSILELLPHTPVTALGINVQAHYKMASESTYHCVGDTLVPKQIWNQLLPGKNVGMADLTVLIQDGTRDKPEITPNVKRISVQPSTRLKFGVYFRMNDHYELDDDGKRLACAGDAAAIVRSKWSATYNASIELFEKILAATSA
jgi:hypothetical protein